MPSLIHSPEHLLHFGDMRCIMVRGNRTLQFAKVGWAHGPAQWERSRPECGSCSGGLEASEELHSAQLWPCATV